MREYVIVIIRSILYIPGVYSFKHMFVECFPAESPGLTAQLHPGNSPSESGVQGGKAPTIAGTKREDCLIRK